MVARVEPFIDVTSKTALTPGAEVTVTARCADLEFTSSKVTSSALTVDDLVAGPGWTPDEALVATGTINGDAEPGVHEVTFTCGEGTSTAPFTVVAGNAPVAPVANPQVPVKPKGAADTGTLDTAATSDQGPNAGVLALGGVALLGAAGGLVVAYRKRRHA